MARLPRIATLAFALLAWNASVRAETASPGPAQAKTPPLIELGASAFARYDIGDFCDVDGDVVSCTSGRAFVGGAIVPRLRLSPLFSVGALGAYVVSLGSEGTASSDGSHEERNLATYRVEAEGRLHPLYPEGIDLWLAVDAGVTVLRDAWDSYDASDRYVSTMSSTDVGSVVGVGLGIDFLLLPFLALGPELRGAALKYPEEEVQYFVSLGVAGTLLLSP